MSDLLDLAREEFEDISPAEKEFINSVAEGRFANYRSNLNKENDPSKADQWGKDRILRASIIVWLCTNSDALNLITRNGIQVSGAKFDGKVNLSFINIPFSLIFTYCSFPEQINLYLAEVGVLNLCGTHVQYILASRLKVRGSVVLNGGFRTNGGINLLQAKIEGQLSFEGSHLDCGNNENKYALVADGITVGGGVFFRDGFTSNGEIRLGGASIMGNLECDGAHISNRGKPSLNAEGINVLGSIFLREGFISEGELNLANAIIGGVLDCDKGNFINKENIAIFADNVEVHGDIFFRSGFYSEGTIKIIGAKISGSIEFDEAQLKNLNNVALQADRLNVGGDIHFRSDFKAEGKIVLTGSNIGGNLECDNSSFNNNGNETLLLESINVGRNVFLRNNFKYNGRINLAGARIKGLLVLKKVNKSSNGELNLTSAVIKSLDFDYESLPNKGNLFLQNLSYEDIFEDVEMNVQQYLDFLNRQNPGYSSQPYEQLAKILQGKGKEEIAKKILIQKNLDQYAASNFSLTNFFKHNILKLVLGFGYRAWRPLWIAIVIVLIDMFIFGLGYKQNILISSPNVGYLTHRGTTATSDLVLNPEFYSFVYSLDLFIPLIDLHQSDNWQPSASKGKLILNINGTRLYLGGVILFLYYIHIILGWILTSLFIVGLTGAIRR